MEVSAPVIPIKSKALNAKGARLNPVGPDNILVRMTAVGLRDTDIPVSNPKGLSAVMAHEGAGVVERVGDQVAKVTPGDHVVLTYLSCGQCIPCQRGYASYCFKSFKPTIKASGLNGINRLRQKSAEISTQRSFLGHSSSTTYALVTERNVVKVRPDVELEMLGPLGCGIQTGAGAVFNTLHVKMGSSIAIFGLGSVGLGAVMAAVVSSCDVIIGVDIDPGRLKIAQALGATHTIDAGKRNPVNLIKKITACGVNYSIESTARPSVFRQAIESLDCLGICGLVGCAPPGTLVTLDMNSIPSGQTIRGIMEEDSVADTFIPQLVDLYVQGKFPIDRLISFYEPDQIPQVIDDMTHNRVINPVLRMK